MTTYENPVRDGAIERPGSLSSLNDIAENTRRRLELGERAGKYLDSVCDGIASGRLDLWQLPFPIASLYLLGYAHGEKSPSSAQARAEFLADYWYHRANNPRAPWHTEAELALWRLAVAS
ncbi:hypothetical protein GCM10009792_13570 [Microcella alkalica]|uniref:Uncharacterized protein n=1 Tax=Microcella alkalica TaxID=355930 RepID=A0A839ECH3_9MICO|nr:hypothetical protein [Microcella alkalica]MBA8847035.1 hypothetical protein [Microcella alkalica]